MEEVKRYTIDFSDGETAEGVLYDDYAALKARVGELGKNNVALKSRAEELQKTCLIYRQSVGDLEKERDSLRAQLEAAKSQIEAWAFRCKEFEAQLEAAKAKLTAQPDGVAVPKSLDIVLSTMRLALNLAEAEGEKPVQMDFKSAETLYVAARLLQKTAAPAREDGVRELRAWIQAAVPIVRVQAQQHPIWHDRDENEQDPMGAHKLLKQAQALASPAPATLQEEKYCKACSLEFHNGGSYQDHFCEKSPAPAKVCECNGSGFIPVRGHGLVAAVRDCPACTPDKEK